MDGRLLALAREDKENIRRRSEAEDRRRHDEAYTRVPALGDIDRRLCGLVRETAASVLGEGRSLAAIREDSLALQGRRAELLAENGWPIDWLDGAWDCPICRDTGYVDGRMCACLRRLYEKRCAQDLSALLKLGSESFDSFDLSLYPDKPTGSGGVTARQQMADIFGLCRDYANTFDTRSVNLLFRGNPGLGKTFLSACVAREVSGRGFSVTYVTAVEAVTAYEDEKFRDDPAAAEKIRRMTDCDLLILDDLGTEMVTEFTKSAIYTLLNTRLIHKKPILISTNLSPDELRARYTPQICSRLEGEFQDLPFVGQDIRRLRKAKGLG